MLIDVDPKTYGRCFRSDPHPFVCAPFVDLNRGKVEQVVRLVREGDKPALGLVAGLKDRTLHSPFSAPFGGFHFRHELVYIGEIERFLDSLKSYIRSQGLAGVDITLPPDIYHRTFNAKTVSCLIRGGFRQETPEITNWVDLAEFDGEFSQKNSREYYRQALRNGLVFEPVDGAGERAEMYELIRQNRQQFGRPIHMTLDDVLAMNRLWPVDFFKVSDAGRAMVAAAMLYRSHPGICHFLFMGDNEAGRGLRAMDFLISSVWSTYKKLGFRYIDLGISTEQGAPNEGLLRFKESHDCVSSLRYRFVWSLG